MAAKKKKGGELIVFDTETTGLPLHPDADLDKQPHIIELGGSILSRSDGRLLRKVEWLIKPPIPVPPDSIRIHGLTDDALAGKPAWGSIFGEIEATFKSMERCIAHNSPFDEFLVNIEMRRLGLIFKWPPKRLCTIGLYRSEFGYDMKLVELFKFVTGEALSQKHRASSDVDALVDIVQKDRLWEL